jgi:hypothetical protein
MRRLSNSRGSNGHCPEQKQDSYYSATDETNFAEMKIVARTGPQLPMIVSGEVDALQLVLEDNLLYTAYQDHSSMLCYKLLRQYAKHLVFKKSSLRILEIGGGTGARSSSQISAQFRRVLVAISSGAFVLYGRNGNVRCLNP